MKDETIRKLLAGKFKSAENPARARKRKLARFGWAMGMMAELKAAQKRADEAWKRLFQALPDDLSEAELEAMNLPDPPEQATLDAIHAKVRAVIDEDRWPRELYWSL